MNKNSKIKLSNGTEMPIIGFGTFRIPVEETADVVTKALNAGYRYIDTAKIYGNEEGVGKAIQESGIPREEIFVTTKLWNADQGYETTLAAIDESLAKLGLSYVDLYLVHWPTASGTVRDGISINKREETWKAMEEIYKSGKAKAIGVSNYMVNHLKEMEQYATIQPMVNQFEFHPFQYQKEVLDYCHEHNIVIQAHSPLADVKGVGNSVVEEIAGRYGKSPAQVFLRWSIQHGAAPVPKTMKLERMEENLNIFDFEISQEDMEKLNKLHENMYVRANPTLFR